MTTAPPQVYPSVDWITATVAEADDADYAYARARALAVEQENAGDTIRPWGANGFKGFGTPHLRCGVRNAEVLVELSGHLADVYWRDFYARASNVSRLDTCVTVTFPTETRRLAYMGYHAERVNPRPGFPAIGKLLLENTDGSETLYVGSPKSARMGRLYDKTAESGGQWPEWSWRWELQERRHMGSTRARMLDGSDDVHRAIRAGVFGFFSYHGVNPWFQSDGPSVFAPARRTRTDLSRRLDYYRRCIAPGVRSGIDRGAGSAILAALGLDDDELLAQLGLAVVDRSELGTPANRPYKGDSPCPPAKKLDDLTPPRPLSGTTPTRPPTGRDTVARPDAPGAMQRWPAPPSGST